MIKKSIWIVNQYTGSPYHGMEHRHYYLAKEFIQQGHQVKMISGSFSHLYKTFPKTKGDFTFEEIDSIGYCWVKVPEYTSSVSISRVFNMLAFKRQLKKLPINQLGNPDVMIVSSPSLFPIKVMYQWAKKLKTKLLFEVRDVWPLTLQELGRLSAYNPLILWMKMYERFAYRKAENIISLLPTAKEHMLKNGMQASKFIYIPNGIDLKEAANAEKLPDDLLSQIPKNKFIVSYVGTLGLANALDFLIAAAKELSAENKIHFLIVGDGGEKMNLKNQAKGLNNITFIDAIPKRQVQSLLQETDLCYIGWRNEKLYRFGISANKLFDYMYAALPVLHSVNAANDPIETSNCGYSVSPENTEEIVKGIKNIYQLSPELRKEMGERGKAYVIKNHSYASLAKTYMDLF